MSTEFEEFVRSLPPREGPFRPFAYRDRDGDGLEVYASDEACFGTQVAPWLTVFLGQQSGAVVGLRIDGFSRFEIGEDEHARDHPV